MKTRIDIVCGYPGTGKSALILQMTASSADCGRVIHFDGGAGLTGITAARLARLIRRDRPSRVLLESSAKPDAFHQLFTWDGLASQAYAGTEALVINAARFPGGEAERQYGEACLCSADIVFVSGAASLPARNTLGVLLRIWEIHRRINVAVEPYQGMDLWKLLDMPSAGRLKQNDGTYGFRKIRGISCATQN